MDFMQRFEDMLMKHGVFVYDEELGEYVKFPLMMRIGTLSTEASVISEEYKGKVRASRKKPNEGDK